MIAAFDAAAVLDALDARDDAVAVHRFVQVRPGDVDVAAASSGRSGHDEAVAAGVRLEPADVEVHLLGQAEALAADLDEIAGGDERVEVALERRALVARHLEELKELADAGGMMHPLAHQRENLIGEKALFVNPIYSVS